MALHYDGLGRLIKKVFYKNNVKDSSSFLYDTSGNIIYESYYIKNKEVFQKGFYSKMQSKLITSYYKVFGDSDKVLYVVLFDSSGNKFYENRFIFNRLVNFYPSKDSVNSNSKSEIKVFTTNLPGYTKAFKVYYLLHDKYEK